MVDELQKQKWAYERLQLVRKEIVESNQSMNDRCIAIIGGAAAISSLAGAAGEGPTPWSIAFIVGVLACAIAAIVLASKVWTTNDTSVPGTFDVSLLWERVVDVEPAAAIANLIGEEIEAAKDEQTLNLQKAKWFRYMLWACWGQVTFSFLAIWAT